MLLLSGGTDGGDVRRVAEMAELIAAADPRTRLGAEYPLPVIYAGNRDAAATVGELLGGRTALTLVPNLRPALERENLAPARTAIHELYMQHVMAHAPGYRHLVDWSPVPVMPTPAAVGRVLQEVALRERRSVVGVDIGGATTDVFSVFGGVFHRTVSANLGLSYSVGNVLAEAGLDRVLRWLPFEADETALRNRVKNKMIRPTTIPHRLDDLMVEHALAREALRLAFDQHRSLAVGLKGAHAERTISDVAGARQAGDSLVDLGSLGLLVGSGGVLSHAPRRVQAALILIDAFEPEGLTDLAVDSVFMMPQLGLLSTVHAEAAVEVFERDCLIRLGAVLAPTGPGRAGRPCVTLELTAPGAPPDTRRIAWGSILRLPLPETGTAHLVAIPERGVDLGAGRGRPLEAEVRGGVVGLVVDARGRPLVLPRDADERIPLLRGWNEALDAYPRGR
jgi:uncharacterized protein (TIGR01319 family)